MTLRHVTRMNRPARARQDGQNSLAQRAATLAMFSLRVAQFGSVVIAGYCVSYLIWMHNHHPCANHDRCPYYFYYQVPVPAGEVVMVVGVSLPAIARAIICQAIQRKPAAYTNSLPTQSVVVALEWALHSSLAALAAASTSNAAPGFILDTPFSRVVLSGVALAAYTAGLAAFIAIPAVRDSWPLCDIAWSGFIYQLPERYFCIVTQNAVSFGLAAW